MLQIISVLLLFLLHVESFEKVVIWGHKLHSSTHSYIHQGFYDGFKHLGYEIYWFDNKDDTSGFDFSNTLFLTEGQVDQEIPLREDGIYLIHNCVVSKYKEYKYAYFQVYTDDVLSLAETIQLDKCIYYHPKDKGMFMPWATNLLPHEIDKIKEQLPHIRRERAVYWIGTIGDGVFGNRSELDPFIRACKKNRIPFISGNEKTSTGKVEEDQHQKWIAAAYLTPTIVGEWQKKSGYIPCRIFKNISYGQMGVTNSKNVYELFDQKIVYNPDTYALFYDAKKRLQTLRQEEIYELMDRVKEKHTYLNRIETMLNFLTILGY